MGYINKKHTNRINMLQLVNINHTNKYNRLIQILEKSVWHKSYEREEKL